MQKKKFTKLYSQIYIPIFLFFLPIIISLFFSRPLMYFTKISFIFPIVSFLFIISPVGSLRIISDNGRKSPFLIWLLAIFFIEIAVFFLFVGQANTVIENMLTLNYFSLAEVQTAWQILTLQVINNPSLFPWSLLAVIAAAFAFFSQKKDPLCPFSQAVPHFSNKELSRLFVRTVDAYIELNGRVFFAVMVGVIAIQIVQMLAIKNSIYNVNNALIISMILVFLARTNKLQALFRKWDDGHLSQGVVFLCMLTIMVIISWIVCIVTIPIIAHQIGTPLFLANISLKLVNKISWQMIWQLWIWSWWVLVAGLLISLFVKISVGRSLRSLVVAILILPVALTILEYNHFFDLASYLNNITQIPTILYSIQIISAVLFITIFLQADSHAAVWLGFFPIKMPAKKRVFSSATTWNRNVGIISLFLLLGVVSLEMVNMLLAIAGFLIFLSMIKINYFKKFEMDPATKPRDDK